MLTTHQPIRADKKCIKALEQELKNEKIKTKGARGRYGGARVKLSPERVHLLGAAIRDKKMSIGSLCESFGIHRSTLYRYFSPSGQLRYSGKKVLGVVKAVGG